MRAATDGRSRVCSKPRLGPSLFLLATDLDPDPHLNLRLPGHAGQRFLTFANSDRVEVLQYFCKGCKGSSSSLNFSSLYFRCDDFIICLFSSGLAIF